MRVDEEASAFSALFLFVLLVFFLVSVPLIVFLSSMEEEKPAYYHFSKTGVQRLPIHVGLPDGIPVSDPLPPFAVTDPLEPFGVPEWFSWDRIQVPDNISVPRPQPPFVIVVPLEPFGIPEWFDPGVLYLLWNTPSQERNMRQGYVFIGPPPSRQGRPPLFDAFDIPIEALMDYNNVYLYLYKNRGDKIAVTYGYAITNTTLYVWPKGLNIGNVSDRALLVLGLSRAVYVVKLILLDLIETTTGKDLLLSDIPVAKVLTFARFYVREDLVPANTSLAIIYGAKVESFSPHTRSHVWRYTIGGSGYHTILAAIMYGMEGEDNYYKVTLDNTTLLERRLKANDTLLEEITIRIEPGQHTTNTTVKLAGVLHCVLEFR